jgi:hypothetical protein
MTSYMAGDKIVFVHTTFCYIHTKASDCTTKGDIHTCYRTRCYAALPLYSLNTDYSAVTGCKTTGISRDIEPAEQG